MSEINDLQKSIEDQITIQKELVIAELKKTKELERQNNELEKNNLIRVEHNKLLNSLIKEVNEIIMIIRHWDDSNYFDNIHTLIEIIIPVLVQISTKINSNNEEIDRLQEIATTIGKRDVNIKKIIGNNLGFGEDIRFDGDI